MGLAGPKQKQRISQDPRNLKWSNDTDKFGYKMLAKMGWNSGKGLGANQDGITSHIKVSQKLNNHGTSFNSIGEGKKTIDNWLENTSAFDALLAQLNESTKDETTREEIVEEKKVEESIVVDKAEEKVNKVVAFGRLAHRKKWLRNKAVSNFDSTSLNDILGVKDIPAPPVIVENKEIPAPVSAQYIVKSNNMSDYFSKKMSKLSKDGASVTVTSNGIVEDDTTNTTNSKKRKLDVVEVDESPEVEETNKKKKKSKKSKIVDAVLEVVAKKEKKKSKKAKHDEIVQDVQPTESVPDMKAAAKKAKKLKKKEKTTKNMTTE